MTGKNSLFRMLPATKAAVFSGPVRGALVLLGVLSGLSAAVAQVDAQAAPGQKASTAAEPLTDAQLAPVVAEIQKEVERLRGWKFKQPVSVAVYTEDELRAFMSRGLAEEAGTPEAHADSETTLKLVGLVPPDCDVARIFEEATSGFVPGIYDHREKKLGVVWRPGVTLDSLRHSDVIAHELVHALDDQHYDLERLLEDDDASSDRQAVIGAVVEGSAVILQERYVHRRIVTGELDAVELWQGRQEQMGDMRGLLEAPPYVSSFLARFPCGVRFLLRGEGMIIAGIRDPGPIGDDLRRVYEGLPRSSEQILHPEKYWDPKKRDEPVVVNDDDIKTLAGGLGLQVVHTDTFGELMCAIVTSPADKKVDPMQMPMPGYWTTKAATGWGGDRFYLLAPAGDQEKAEAASGQVGMWLTYWDTQQDRDEFAEAYQEHRKLVNRVYMKLGERGGVFFFGVDSAQQAALQQTLRSRPPRLTRSGKSGGVHP
ncbi:MAG: hypothetical protein KKB50_03660 [Planctomycetes bacterium]|nr:hypothetical protein [Planctomycetota bacterium]